jgi:hypothetical protein
MFEFEKNRELIIGFVVNLIIFLFFGGLNYPWYPLVFLPYTVIASGVFVRDLLTDQSPIRLGIFFLFPFSSTLYWGYNVFHDSATNLLVYRFFLLIFLLLASARLLRNKWPILKYVSLVALLVVLWKVYQWNIYGFQYIIANWGKLPEGFFLKF